MCGQEVFSKFRMTMRLSVFAFALLDLESALGTGNKFLAALERRRDVWDAYYGTLLDHDLSSVAFLRLTIYRTTRLSMISSFQAIRQIRALLAPD